ncbi:hypothetical protein GCK72_007359 [Caenorhabditis remanei]|uniref:BTB domain-containing protein n=1 Tax=Caenorhabditis remanei TaxID=31234 RepID=A0A6A5HH57_CAERE|nr:hypothetical protein GCK72_007359 [Caenorhabditis remanei]KAF1767400.1 hypothetical protein GCK72_007359 [Caenorhabditis remanei]
MPVPEEKEFVMRHCFSKWYTDEFGPKEIRYNIPWSMQLYCKRHCLEAYLFCWKEDSGWSIDADYEVKFVGKRKSFGVKGTVRFDGYESFANHMLPFAKANSHLVNDKLKVEWRIKINKMTGFDDEDSSGNKENDDIVLKVKGEKFEVDKKFLGENSTYFNNLFFKSSDESGKTEIELEDVDPQEFKKFLKVLREEEPIDDETVEEILKLADKYDSKNALKRCEEFLIDKSKKPLKMKFNAAIQYKLNKLKKKCMSNMESKEDIQEIAEEDARHFNASVWKELLQKALSLD